MGLVFRVVALLLLYSVPTPLGGVGGRGEADQSTANTVCDDGKVSFCNRTHGTDPEDYEP